MAKRRKTYSPKHSDSQDKSREGGFIYQDSEVPEAWNASGIGDNTSDDQPPAYAPSPIASSGSKTYTQDDIIEDVDDSVPQKTGTSVKESFQALTKRPGHSRRLKSTMNQQSSLQQKIDADTQILLDNQNILQNFDTEMSTQRQIINQATKARKTAADAYSGLKKKYDPRKKQLDSLLKKQASELKEYNDRLKQARKSLEDAEGVLKRAERDLKDAKDGNSAQQRAVDLADAARDQAQEVVDARQLEYDNKKSAQEDQAYPLEREVKELEQQMRAQDQERQKQDNIIEAANNRIKYASWVISHPEETNQLLEKVSQNKASAEQLGTTIDDLQARKQDLKRRSRKAVAILVLVLVVLAIIVILGIISQNGG